MIQVKLARAGVNLPTPTGYLLKDADHFVAVELQAVVTADHFPDPFAGRRRVIVRDPTVSTGEDELRRASRQQFRPPAEHTRGDPGSLGLDKRRPIQAQS